MLAFRIDFIDFYVDLSPVSGLIYLSHHLEISSKKSENFKIILVPKPLRWD